MLIKGLKNMLALIDNSGKIRSINRKTLQNLKEVFLLIFD